MELRLTDKAIDYRLERFIKLLLCSQFLLFATYEASSQVTIKDQRNQLLHENVSYLAKKQSDFFNINREFVNGRLHIPRLLYNTHPYFSGNAWKTGRITYKNRIFEISDKRLKYDLYADELIYLNITDSSSYSIELNKEFIPLFFIENHEFQVLDDIETKKIKKYEIGYYEVLYNGKTKLYKRWKKEPEIDNTKMKTAYLESSFMLVKKDEQYFEINSLLKLKALLRDRRKEVAKFISNVIVPLNTSTEEKMISILEYYDSIKFEKN